jgi:hypothetical protein
MSREIETIVYTECGVRVSVSNWDEDSVWLHLGTRYGTCHAVLTRVEAEQLFNGLKTILAEEVTA